MTGTIQAENSTILESITDAFVSLDAAWNFTYVNAQAERIYKKSRAELLGRNFWDVFPTARNSIFEETYTDVMTTRRARVLEAFFKPLDESWFEINIYPLKDGGLAFYFRDITARKKMEAIVEGQRRAMELALADTPITQILEVLTNAVEAQSGNGAIACIMLADAQGKRLHNGAGPSLPEAYRRAVDGMEIGPASGSCGTSAFTQKMTIVEDIANDPLWAPVRDLALGHNLRACWSTPIISSHGRTLGTFAVYYPEVRGPVENDRNIVAALVQTAAVIIERTNYHAARIEAETALRRSDESMQRERRVYETVMSNTPDFIYTFDLQRRFNYINKSLLEMWGRTWENSTGRTFHELGYEPWHAEMHDRELIEVIATKKAIRGEVPFNGTFGRRIYDYIFVPVLNDAGDVEAVIGTTRDVTHRKEAEDTLRASESRFRFLTELEEATRGVGDAGRIMEIATRMTAEHLKSSRCAYADLEPDGDHFTIRADYVADGSASTVGFYSLDLFGSKAVADLNAARTLVIRNVDAELAAQDGGDMFRAIGIQAIITIPLVKDGQLRAMMAAHQNVPRDWTPDEIRLMEIVAERSWAYIERVRHEAMLLEADRKKDEFLATLAHELRNPLAPIRNALHIFEKGGADEKVTAGARELMTRQVGQMIRLVDDLMDVSRITHGKIELRQETVTLAAVIHSATETAQPLLSDKKHTLAVDLPPQDIFVTGDPVRLGQIFSNLLNNAAKYTNAGGSIGITAALSGDTVSIAVTDNGIGIPPEKLGHVFDMFTQVDSSIERAQGGLGIGLTLVKNLVERHGGTISVASGGAGKGSRFTVTLPVSKAAAPAKPAAPATAPRAMLKVMVVDDNRDSAQTMGWTMELLGCEARVLTNAADAIAAAKDYLPDVVLLDIGMPGMSGYDLCRHLRAQPGLENTMFIAQTGWGQAEHRQKSKEAGFHHHLVKPIDMKELGALLAAKA
jgi:PAS domain S-box-containing protein